MNVTRPDLLTPGYWFVAPYVSYEAKEEGDGWIGPHIYDQEGHLVWSGAPLVGHSNVEDFRISNVAGKERLTFISQKSGSATILNESYEVVHDINVAEYWPDGINTHELNFVDDGSRMIVIKNHWEDASIEESASIGLMGEQCSVDNEWFSVMDTSTWKETFSWHSLGHISLDETTYTEYREDHSRAAMCGGYDYVCVRSSRTSS